MVSVIVFTFSGIQKMTKWSPTIKSSQFLGFNFCRVLTIFSSQLDERKSEHALVFLLNSWHFFLHTFTHSFKDFLYWVLHSWIEIFTDHWTCYSLGLCNLLTVLCSFLPPTLHLCELKPHKLGFLSEKIMHSYLLTIFFLTL